MGSGESIKRVSDIIQANDYSSSINVVVSAFGGVTDILIEALTLAERSLSYKEVLKRFSDKTVLIAESLFSSEKLETILAEFSKFHEELHHVLYGVSLIQEASDKTKDYILSFGERCSAKMLSSYLESIGHPSSFVDARGIIKTDHSYGSAGVNFEISNELIRSRLNGSIGINVITGFIGSDAKSGRTTTLGRGGSDYTAAIIAAALNADELQIWTDVSGVLSADPRKVKKAKSIPELTYAEALELSHFGAKVLYAPTIRPVREKGIPTRIKNTFDPSHPGTLIHANKASGAAAISGVTAIENIALLSLEGSGLQGVIGSSARLFACLAKQNINVIMITQASSEHSICIAVEEGVADEARSHIHEEFSYEVSRGLVEPVRIHENMCLVAIVGENMKKRVGVAGYLFSVLGKNGINIEAIAQGSSELNISFAIDSRDLIKALNTIHDAFVLSGNKSVHLFMVGTGLVGKTLLRLLKENQVQILRENKLEFVINGLSNSRRMLLDPEGLKSYDASLLNDESLPKAELKQFISKMAEYNFANSIFIDNTASGSVPSHYEEVLSYSIDISTPNKVALSSGLKQYEKLKSVASQNSCTINYETNVGAGLPVLFTLNNLVKSGDRITKIEAVLSGSLSFIFNNFDGSENFSSLVRKAQKLGFTEPDPREDLSGNDVKRKLLILAREAGFKTRKEDVTIEAMFEDDIMSSGPVDSFFRFLETQDKKMLALVHKAQKNNEKLCFLARFENNRGTIGLGFIPESSAFYSLSGSDNMIAFYSNRYNTSPLLVSGPGAGAEVTAAGVLAEIINISGNKPL